jgi:outer membrane protein
LKNYIQLISIILIVALGIYLFTRPQHKAAYILNQKVFNAFEGKKELETKLRKVQDRQKHWLDSVRVLVEQRNDLMAFYRETEANFSSEREELTEQYTAETWKRINQYVTEYGKKNDYDFIFGAAGDGNLMYANEHRDISEEIIIFINKRYQEGD